MSVKCASETTSGSGTHRGCDGARRSSGGGGEDVSDCC